jgi:hypothetical protein
MVASMRLDLRLWWYLLVYWHAIYKERRASDAADHAHHLWQRLTPAQQARALGIELPF